MTEQKIAYNLVVDEDRDRILNSFIALLKADKNIKLAYFTYLADQKLSDTFIDLFDEISTKSHNNFGCKDKDCIWL